jgi:hypothetical protein
VDAPYLTLLKNIRAIYRADMPQSPAYVRFAALAGRFAAASMQRRGIEIVSYAIEIHNDNRHISMYNLSKIP